jgi:NAD(P)-dependent dehydrogenase (short-subunit alcohol dehydrogenase family)
MDNADISGRTCLVTGATSGHGEAVAKGLARMGADLVLLGRSREKFERVRSEILDDTGRAPDFILADLSSQSDIRRSAAEFISWNRPLHVLVNNAGLVNQHFRETVDGIEETFAVNYLAMFKLTLLLLDRIVESAPARIINVSSDTHRIADLDLDDVQARGKRYGLMGAYGRSKLAIVYFTLELSKRLASAGVTVNAVDPGPIASGIAKKNELIAKIADAVIQLAFPKPERAARTALYLASSPEAEGVSGGYWRFMKKKEPKISADPDFGAKLWKISARMTG